MTIIFTLFGVGRTVINLAGYVVNDVIDATEFCKVFWGAELESNANREIFTERMFIV